MRTPAGTECKYFYGDYYRGRNQEECRLLSAAQPPQKWTADLCTTCPVPGISRANACENLMLNGKVVRSPMKGFQRRVQVVAYCRKVEMPVDNPHIGCGECHPLPPAFEVRQ